MNVASQCCWPRFSFPIFLIHLLTGAHEQPASFFNPGSESRKWLRHATDVTDDDGEKESNQATVCRT